MLSFIFRAHFFRTLDVVRGHPHVSFVTQCRIIKEPIREGEGEELLFCHTFQKGKTLASADLIDGEKLKLLGHYGKI